MSSPPKPFVILTMVRCGSYFLSSLLDSATDVCCYGEIYKKQSVELPDRDLRRLGLLETDVIARNHFGEKFLDHVVGLNPRKVTGFKAFLDHFDAAQMPELPGSKKWRKIFLTRNVVEQYVSLVRARNTGIYTYFEGEDIDQSILERQVCIDFDDFQAFVDYRNDVDRAFKGLQRRIGTDEFEIVDYADLQDMQTLQRLLYHIGSKARANELHSFRRKQFLRPMHDGIENFEKFCDYLRQTDQQTLLPKEYLSLDQKLRKLLWRKRAA